MSGRGNDHPGVRSFTRCRTFFAVGFNLGWWEVDQFVGFNKMIVFLTSGRWCGFLFGCGFDQVDRLGTG